MSTIHERGLLPSISLLNRNKITFSLNAPNSVAALLSIRKLPIRQFTNSTASLIRVALSHR